MSSIEIEGGHRLYGEVQVQGSKNATLPIMAAALLNSGISILKNYPDIEDVRQMKLLLESLGCRIILEDDQMIIDSQPAAETVLEQDVTGKIRASSVLLGPMLARFHHVKIAQPGGCRIGKRPLDIHMNVFKAFGASWSMDENFIEVECTRLHPAQIRMSKRSVGATENAIMTAAYIKGRSRIFNGAVEPEIIALCDYLKAAGTFIQIDDDNTITVEGRECSHASIDIPGDRIVAGTYMGAVTACGGRLKLSGVRLQDCRGFLNVFAGMGMQLKNDGIEAVTITMDGRPSAINMVETEPYPGFPTDMQSIVMACAAMASGRTVIKEKIFDNRLGAAVQLNRMNANIHVRDNTACINGVERLKGAAVMAQDLRGAAALLIAAMSAEGVTYLNNTEYLDRGYVDLCGTFNRLGARIHEK
ncbi:MAG: UDP-N-acetylglucosamine 1-carboxyvinyltransferase [Eubacteriales bacterium]|nr:UDP-N-acetylglucosamine 1-carboxyvinyltransferase [Eubacteriales bacterium]